MFPYKWSLAMQWADSQVDCVGGKKLYFDFIIFMDKYTSGKNVKIATTYCLIVP